MGVGLQLDSVMGLMMAVEVGVAVWLDNMWFLSRRRVWKGLEKHEIAFKLIGHVLVNDNTKIDNKLLELSFIAKKQLQSLSAFLKIRKRDWNEQGQLLKARVVAKLSVYQAAARMKIESLRCFTTDGKTTKRLVLETLALLLDAAESCLLSVWRKLRVCEELFSSLLSGIAQIAVNKGGQPMRVLLIRLKPLVLTACAQAHIWAGSQGAMFESVMQLKVLLIGLLFLD